MSDVKSDVKIEVILPLITAHVVDKLIKRYGWSEDEAINNFTKSYLYELLEDEKTKVWHYSTHMLAELYGRELDGKLIFPEV